MLLNSFAFEKPEITIERMGKIWQAIEKNEPYIQWCVKKENVPTTKQLMFFHAITHFDATEDKLQGYLRKLAQTIFKTVTGPEILVDLSDENMVYAVGHTNGGGKPNEDNLVIKAPDKVTPDFSTDIINSLYMEEDLQHDLYALVMNNLVEYVNLCKTLLSGNVETVNFSVPFIKACLSLSSTYKDEFNAACLKLYEIYQPIFDRFAFETIPDKSIDNIESLWQETDYTLISKKKSKRIIFYNKKTNKPVEDADNEKFYVVGAKNLVDVISRQEENSPDTTNIPFESKRILKVTYFDAWLYLCDKIDSNQTNELKLILGDNFLIKTLGGSLSIVNPVLYNIYELLKAEFLTNILYETSGRLLCTGTKSVYILWDKNWPTIFQQNMGKMEKIKDKKWIEHKNLFGVEFDLIYEDVTMDLDCR